MNKTILAEKLNSKHIAERSDGNMKLSYIESHHAIREANRAFDFDGWSQQVSELKLIQEETKVNKWKKELYYAGYTATVKVIVKTDTGYVEREDVGFGQGINADKGKAHEGAVKEAISDASKRALRTFGDIFGLALYDKDQTNVEDVEEQIDPRVKSGGTNKPNNKQSNGTNSSKAIQGKTNKTYTPEEIKNDLSEKLSKNLTQENMKEIYNLCKANGLDLINDYPNKDIQELAKTATAI